MSNSLDYQRVFIETQAIAQFFSQFEICDLMGDPYFLGWVYTSSGGMYKLHLQLLQDFPYRAPVLYVVSPWTLWMHGHRKTINSLGDSHAYHVRDNGNTGCVKICHTYRWDASITCLKVLCKGYLWCEAYEAHLATGNTIAYYLPKDV